MKDLNNTIDEIMSLIDSDGPKEAIREILEQYGRAMYQNGVEATVNNLKREEEIDAFCIAFNANSNVFDNEVYHQLVEMIKHRNFIRVEMILKELLDAEYDDTIATLLILIPRKK